MNRISERGFTLLEMICVLALIAMMAAVLLPFVPHHTSRSRLQGYVLQTAALLKGDRNAAIRSGTGVATLVDAESRVIRSGATADMIRIPDDVHFEALLPRTCDQRAALSTIRFFASGMSCGGAVALTRADVGYEVRVNWLTGRVEIVSRNAAN
ncbi:prepilin-type N-terminal cleavage/methylation domain-containing protein [Bradyrhizobium sp.]|jgi:general secretion pathway protein H|uniref:prepilin-type N-terminal cleavage/methylation domain-containing protein n=1 Tax=Bradyrhizobium sp. TaxID=376 RepID=UPI003BB1EEF4